MSQDPIRFAGGDANLYRYCGNETTTRTDPFGLWVWPWDPNASWNPYTTVSLWTGVPQNQLPHGAGVVGGVQGEIGVGMGGGFQGSVGAGVFTQGIAGAFASGGATVTGPGGPGFSAVADPNNPNNAGLVVGADIGIGGGCFFTNGARESAINGPFKTTTITVLVFNLQFATAPGNNGDVWFFSVTAGKGDGGGVSQYSTNTTGLGVR